MNIDTINTRHSYHSKQQGAALIVSLIILLVLTILGVQGMQTTTLEEKMAGNFRDKKMAFEAAEAALLAAQDWIDQQESAPEATDAGTNRVYSFASASLQSSSLWSGASSTSVTTNLPNLSSSPRYVIEARGAGSGSGGSGKTAELGAVSSAYSVAGGTTMGYRITARGTGGTNNAVVLLQSDFEKVF